MLVLLVGAAAPARAAVVPPGFEERVLATGLTLPTTIAWLPSGELLVAEKAGLIRRVAADGTIAPAPLLDLRDRVNDHHDRGLLGMAVASRSGGGYSVYALYTREPKPLDPQERDESYPTSSRLERFDFSAAGVLEAEVPILGTYGGSGTTYPDDFVCPAPQPGVAHDCLPSDASTHSIGSVRLDPADGTLWVSTGDGASATVDPLAHRARDPHVLAGKILHVDAQGRGLPGHPFCPSEANLAMACTKVFSMGFRNPFRIHLRPSGGVIAGDVGWSHYEELNLAVPGGDFGWPCFEGGEIQKMHAEAGPACDDAIANRTDIRPLYRYAHFDDDGVFSDAAIVAGPIWTGDELPGSWKGDAIVGDYVRGFLGRVKLDDQGQCVEFDDRGECRITPWVSEWYGGVALEQSPAGELAYVAIGTGGADGSVRAIRSVVDNYTPVAALTTSFADEPGGFSIRFDAGGSHDEDADPLEYTWDFGDGSPPETTTVAQVVHAYASAGIFQAKVTVSDGKASSDAHARVVTGDRPPGKPAIASPTADSTWTGSKPMALRGSALDHEDGALSGAGLKWHINLRHARHLHPFSIQTGTSAAFTPTDDHDFDSTYEIRLEAIDSKGQSTMSDLVVVDPEIVDVRLRSLPEGAEIDYGDRGLIADGTFKTVAGHTTRISTPETFVAEDGKTYEWVGWNDGGARSHDVTIGPLGCEFLAIYKEVGAPTPTIETGDPCPDPPDPTPTSSPSPSPSPTTTAEPSPAPTAGPQPTPTSTVAPSPTPGPSPTPSPRPTPTPPARPGTPRLALRGKVLTVDRKHRIAVPSTCRGTATARCSVRLLVRVGKRSIGSASATLRGGSRRTVRLKLSRTGIARLRKGRITAKLVLRDVARRPARESLRTVRLQHSARR